MKRQIGIEKPIPQKILSSPEEIGKYMKIKHSKNDIIDFCMNDSFLLSPLAQVVQIHQYFFQYFLNNFITYKGSYSISKLKNYERNCK